MKAVTAKMRALLRHVNHITGEKRLNLALGIAITAALVLVSISMVMYQVTGYNKLDLSRPGFEKERQDLAKAAPQKTYDTNSPITLESLDEFLTELATRSNDLKIYSRFGDNSLGDEELGLPPR